MGHDWAKGTLASILLATLVVVAVRVPAWRTDTPKQESMAGIVESLFEPWVLAFELLSLLLLAALIGSLYLATKTPAGEEDLE